MITNFECILIPSTCYRVYAYHHNEIYRLTDMLLLYCTNLCGIFYFDCSVVSGIIINTSLLLFTLLMLCEGSWSYCSSVSVEATRKNKYLYQTPMVKNTHCGTYTLTSTTVYHVPGLSGSSMTIALA